MIVSCSIYLLRPAFAQVWNAAGSGTPISTSGLANVFANAVPGIRRKPQWLPAVNSLLGASQPFDLYNESAGALLTATFGAQTYVIAFGTGWSTIPLKGTVRDFGRKVVLSAINANKLRHVQRDQIFTNYLRAAERAPEATKLDAFGFDVMRDMVGAVEGDVDATVKHLGTHVYGATALRATIDLANLANVLGECGKLYASKAGAQKFPDLESFAEVIDDQLIKTLDTSLDAHLVAANPVVLQTPLAGPGTSYVHQYRFGRNTPGSSTHPVLEFNFWKSYLASKPSVLNLQSARDTPLHLLDEDLETLGDSCVYDAFCFESSIKGDTYVLSDGAWYSVSSSLQQHVGDVLKKLKQGKTSLQPKWNASMDEGQFNAAAAAAGGLVLMDKKLVHYGGNQSKFEFCDLLDSGNKALLFAKIPTKSAAMSHLIEQVRRTVQLFFSPDASFRKKLAAKHPAIATMVSKRPRPGDWELCIVSLGRAAKALPLFAQCSLAHLVRDLERDGHVVAYTVG